MDWWESVSFSRASGDQSEAPISFPSSFWKNIVAEKTYLIRLGDGARKRHCHKTEKGQVIAFMVQLEVKVEESVWRIVLRYGCAHDFAHKDRYNIQGEQDKEELSLTYTEALDLADKDINDNWEVYKERFLRGIFP